jgi:hypothetical protein
MDSQTKRHVVVGAIVSFVFSGYTGAPLLGGVLAGYLNGPPLRSGVRAGVLAGVVALIASLALSVGTTLLEIGPISLTTVLWKGLLNPALLGIVPFVILPLVGGGIGAHVRHETDG